MRFAFNASQMTPTKVTGGGEVKITHSKAFPVIKEILMLANAPSLTRSGISEQASQTVIALATLSASLIHDLRNPLAAISAGTELLMDMNAPSPHFRRLVSNIHRASRHVEELFGDLVDISHSGREPLQQCKLTDLLQSAFEHIADAAASQGVCVEIIIPDGIWLSTRKRCIERVFLNMMNNALESMPAGGELRISARVERDDLNITIDDTGSGVPDQVRSKLFEPFASAGKKNGTGLGLALSRQIVLDHGGDLWLGRNPVQALSFACVCRFSSRPFSTVRHGLRSNVIEQEAVVGLCPCYLDRSLLKGLPPCNMTF